MPIPRFSEDESAGGGEASPGSGAHSDWLYLHDNRRRMRRALAMTSSTRRPQDQPANPAGGGRTRTDLTTDAALETFLGRAEDGGVDSPVTQREMRAVLDTLAQAIAAGDAPGLGAQLQLPEGFFPDE